MADLISTARDPLLVAALYSNPKHYVDNVGANGAISVNQAFVKAGDPFFIEQQRYGADCIQAGCATKNRAEIARGLLILDWGFARQSGADGSFPGTGDAWHSTSFFIEAAARSIILLHAFDSAGYAGKVAEYRDKTDKAARWLMGMQGPASLAAMQTGIKNNLPYTHRRFLVAAAVGLTASAIGRMVAGASLAEKAAGFAREGLALIAPDGMCPEKGGSDTSYQMVGLTMAARYQMASAAFSPSLASLVRAGLLRGLAWELWRVKPDGTIDTSGDTRTGTEAGRTGATKTVDYKNILEGFVFGAAITGDARFEDAATRVARAHHWIA